MREAAVGLEELSGDPTALVGEQKPDEVRRISRGRNATDRVGATEPFAQVWRHPSGVGWPGGHGVDGDPSRGYLASAGQRHPVDCALGRRVGDGPDQRWTAQEVDDPAWAAFGLVTLDQFADEQLGAAHVDCEMTVEFRAVHLENPAARVVGVHVHEGADRAEHPFIARRGEGRFRGLLGGHLTVSSQSGNSPEVAVALMEG